MLRVVPATLLQFVNGYLFEAIPVLLPWLFPLIDLPDFSLAQGTRRNLIQESREA